MGVQFRVLGDVAAHVGGRVVNVGHARQRCVLLALLVDANRVVSVDQLVDRVWADRVPQRVRGALYNYLSRLRRSLAGSADVAIVRGSGGYVLTVDPLAVDLHLFQHLTARAQAAVDDDAAGLFAQALGLWRGEAFATLDTPWLNTVRETVNHWRIAAELDRNDVELRRGRHADLLAELSSRAATLPLDERLAGQLMLALYRCGRQADALNHYRQTRSRLAEDLGIDPGPGVRTLHQRILAADPALDAPAVERQQPIRPDPTMSPRQLPAPPRAFTGRIRELAQLDAVLAPMGVHPTEVPIVVVSGTAGVGKTTLVVHWAHRIAARFLDGQLYLDMHGFGPDDGVVSPVVALRFLLEAFGVPAPSAPTEPAALAALYRSTVAGRRILVVLDNVRDAAQVRPLLPGSPEALVVITSRDRLMPLVAVEGAEPVALDLPTAEDARRLLVRRAGPAWAGVDPEATSDAVDEIVARCARLPLALAIAAARAATGLVGAPESGPDRLVGELRAAGGRLDVFAGGDPGTDVRAVFSWSYAALTEPAARLFRLIGLLAGPDVSMAAVVGLGGAPPIVVHGLVRELTRASLLIEHRPGRFACHDLLRAYASELAGAADAAADGRAALRRVFDHYLHTAHSATLQLNPSWDQLPLDGPMPGSAPVLLTTNEQALAWYSAEFTVLVAAVAHAYAVGGDTHAWQLAWTLTDHLERQGEWARWVAVQQTGLDAGRRLGDQLAQAHLHRGLGRASMWQTRFSDAIDHFQRALRLFEDLGDLAGQARIWHNLCQTYDQTGDRELALDCGRQALRLSRQIGDRAAIAKELNTVAWCLAEIGELGSALRHGQEALALWREVHDVLQEAATWDTAGYIHHRLGDFDAALDCFRHCLPLMREIGDRYHEASVLVHSGDSLLALGEREQARQVWQQGLRILADLAHPEQAEVLARLDARG